MLSDPGGENPTPTPAVNPPPENAGNNGTKEKRKKKKKKKKKKKSVERYTIGQIVSCIALTVGVFVVLWILISNGTSTNATLHSISSQISDDEKGFPALWEKLEEHDEMLARDNTEDVLSGVEERINTAVNNAVANMKTEVQGQNRSMLEQLQQHSREVEAARRQRRSQNRAVLKFGGVPMQMVPDAALQGGNNGQAGQGEVSPALWAQQILDEAEDICERVNQFQEGQVEGSARFKHLEMMYQQMQQQLLEQQKSKEQSRTRTIVVPPAHPHPRGPTLIRPQTCVDTVVKGLILPIRRGALHTPGNRTIFPWQYVYDPYYFKSSSNL